MYITEIIIGLISMIVGGGGIWLFTIKSTREKARAEAMKEVQDVYQETITDLREDKRLLKEEKDGLIVEINEMKQSIYSLKKDVEQLKMKNMREKCLNFACKERIIE
jgi:predicted RNase H-like nuclease (RuvC/YqgF family)